MTNSRAALIYEMYLGHYNLSPLVGALFADRVIGSRWSIIAGGLLMAIGHFAMVVPALLFAGLVVIAIGIGLFVAPLTRRIAQLYSPDDPRRESSRNITSV